MKLNGLLSYGVQGDHALPPVGHRHDHSSKQTAIVWLECHSRLQTSHPCTNPEIHPMVPIPVDNKTNGQILHILQMHEAELGWNNGKLKKVDNMRNDMIFHVLEAQNKPVWQPT